MSRVFALLVVTLAAIATITQSIVFDLSPTPTENASVFAKNEAQRNVAGRFFLHLLKHKIQYQRLEKVSTTPPTSDCVCVPYYLCDANTTTVITDGSGSIDIRYRRCTGDLEVCCKLPNATASMAPIVTPTTPTPSTTPTTPKTTPTTPTTTKITPTTTASATTKTTATTATTMTPTPKPQTMPTAPPIIFPSAQPTQPVTIFPTGAPGLNCICVPSWQCNSLDVLPIATAGEGLINPRQSSLCPGTDQVCCRLSSIVTIPPIISPTVQSTRTQICFICGNTLQCTNSEFVIPLANAFGPLKFPGTPNSCYCVKTWLCSAGNVVNLDGAGIIDPRFTACASADEVCCRPTGIIASSEVFRDAKEARGSIVDNEPPDPSVVQVVCGVRDTTYAPAKPYPAESGKTYFAEFPWMVALLMKQTDGKYLFQCGASMINNRAVLTAAHCVVNRQNGELLARFGQWDVRNNSEPYQELSVKAIIPHPLYYSGGLFHDVAVLILNNTAKYATNVVPICLPQQSMVFSAGTKCYATGWGSNAFDSNGEYQTQLRKVDLPIVDQSDCQSRLRTTKLGPYFRLHGSFICAGGESKKDTCRGDGGGPLVCPTSTGQFIQAGIVSWGIGCGESNVPAVYASVSQHKQWIDQQLANYGAQ